MVLPVVEDDEFDMSELVVARRSRAGTLNALPPAPRDEPAANASRPPLEPVETSELLFRLSEMRSTTACRPRRGFWFSLLEVADCCSDSSASPSSASLSDPKSVVGTMDSEDSVMAWPVSSSRFDSVSRISPIVAGRLSIAVRRCGPGSRAGASTTSG